MAKNKTKTEEITLPVKFKISYNTPEAKTEALKAIKPHQDLVSCGINYGCYSIKCKGLSHES